MYKFSDNHGGCVSLTISPDFGHGNPFNGLHECNLELKCHLFRQ